MTATLYSRGLCLLPMIRDIIEKQRRRKYEACERSEYPGFLNDFGSALEEEGQSDAIRSVCFINGCSYRVPHPIRYRVDHQCEQLRYSGIRAISFDEWDISFGLIEEADLDCLIIFRAPMTRRLGRVLDWANKRGIRTLFDIDDLVVDTQYTSNIQYVKDMPRLRRQRYDRGVSCMKETMLRCDEVLTSTTGMAEELRKYKNNVIVNRNVASSEMVYWSDMALAQKRNHEGVRLGYFSGSITHNEDFRLIIPELVKIFDEREEVSLTLVGELELPCELNPYRDRIKSTPFVSWRSLPFLLASVDINLAPLTDTVFNRAKSENKWVEAALVRVPTIASSVGAFEEMMVDGETGALCSTPAEWHETLVSYIDNCSLRARIGAQARKYCLRHCTTRLTAESFKRKLT